MKYEIIGKSAGYIVRKPNGNFWFYLSSVYKGKYKWVTDHTNAKYFSLKTAKKHIEILNYREGINKADLKTNYKKQLEKAKENNINITDLMVAYKVHHMFDWVTDYEFEKICELIKNAYLKSEYVEIWQLVRALYIICENDEENDILQVVANTSISSLIDEADEF